MVKLTTWHSGLEVQLCFFLPTTRHQEIQGVGYAHHTCVISSKFYCFTDVVRGCL